MPGFVPQTPSRMERTLTIMSQQHNFAEEKDAAVRGAPPPHQ